MRVRIEIDRKGIGDLLASPGVQRMLDAKATRVAFVARARGIRVEGDDAPGEIALPIETADWGNSRRARAAVVVPHPSGEAVESKHRLLGGALGAARG